jgi:hypothetical protein
VGNKMNGLDPWEKQGEITNKELVAQTFNINEKDLCSLGYSPNQWFFWNGHREYEVIIEKNKRVAKEI